MKDCKVFENPYTISKLSSIIGHSWKMSTPLITLAVQDKKKIFETPFLFYTSKEIHTTFHQQYGFSFFHKTISLHIYTLTLSQTSLRDKDLIKSVGEST